MKTKKKSKKIILKIIFLLIMIFVGYLIWEFQTVNINGYSVNGTFFLKCKLRCLTTGHIGDCSVNTNETVSVKADQAFFESVSSLYESNKVTLAEECLCLNMSKDFLINAFAPPLVNDLVNWTLGEEVGDCPLMKNNCLDDCMEMGYESFLHTHLCSGCCELSPQDKETMDLHNISYGAIACGDDIVMYSKDLIGEPKAFRVIAAD